jgi:opacity protein-like surface antigen
MNKSVRVIAAALLFAGAAAATDWQKYEIYTGYAFVKFNPQSDPFPSSLNANGGNGQFVYNFNKYIGAAVDLGAVTKGTINGFSVDATNVNFVAGPRFTWQGHGRFKPYVQALFGGAYTTASTRFDVLPAVSPGVLPPGLIIPPGFPVTARLVASKTGFAMLAGGGLDIKVTKNVWFRPFEASYYLTRMPTFANEITGNQENRNNFRYSGGVNFMFGGPR